MSTMVQVTRLLTLVEVDDPVLDPRRLSVSARHEAVLSDGRRVPLLTDRGWSVSGPPDAWAETTVEEIEQTARTVVGPDEPFGRRSREDMAADHWTGLAGLLRRHDVQVDPEQLERLPHGVVLGEQLLARLGSQPDGATSP